MKGYFFIILFIFSCDQSERDTLIDVTQFSHSKSECEKNENSICYGGYDSDPDAKALGVNIIYSSPAGTKLVSNIEAHAEEFIERMNANYQFRGHQFIKLVLNKAIGVESVDEDELISKYAEKNILSLILVANIPGSSAGYVRNFNADPSLKQAWAVFEFSLVNAGVAEHEINHLFGFPHTTSRNGSNPIFFQGGYRSIQDVFKSLGVYREKLNYAFNIFIDPNNQNERVEVIDGMEFHTRNLMYDRVLEDRPGLFTEGSTGYHYSYSHLFNYYYQSFIKGK